MGLRKNKKSRRKTYILIGDGFDELEVVYFLHSFRRAGLSIKSVSLFNQVVFGRQGVGIQADFQLSDHPVDPAQDCLLVLPAGGRNGDMLRHDARVKSLLESFNGGNGRVAVTNHTCDLANDVDRLLTRRPTIQPASDQGLDDFVNLLTKSVSPIS